MPPCALALRRRLQGVIERRTGGASAAGAISPLRTVLHKAKSCIGESTLTSCRGPSSKGAPCKTGEPEMTRDAGISVAIAGRHIERQQLARFEKRGSSEDHDYRNRSGCRSRFTAVSGGRGRESSRLARLPYDITAEGLKRNRDTAGTSCPTETLRPISSKAGKVVACGTGPSQARP